MSDVSEWDPRLRTLYERCGRGLEGEMLTKFTRHLNEMKHLTTDKQLGEFLWVYALGGEVDDALNRAMKAMRIYIGSEK